MKNFELLDFKIWGNLRTESNTAFVRIYFDDLLIIDKKIIEEKNFKFEFSKICSFQKHKLIVISNDYQYFSISGLQINRLFINDFNQNIIDYKEVSNLGIKIYEFNFESPYAYYFLDRM